MLSRVFILEGLCGSYLWLWLCVMLIGTKREEYPVFFRK